MRTGVADDRELWERICGGDSGAFEAFYRDHAPRLQNFLRQLFPASPAAEDVAQETFLDNVAPAKRISTLLKGMGAGFSTATMPRAATH
jgi:DNA-directed RNA polymerase specialized sigma24 family protein